MTPSPGRASRLSVHDVSPVYVARPGDSAVVSAQVTNPGPVQATAISLTPAAPTGWTITPVGTGPTSLAPGQTGTWQWQVTAPADADPGRYPGTLTLQYASGGQAGLIAQDLPMLLGIVPHAGMTASTDSSQSADYAASKAIDDDPTTMWHTQWSPYQPLPHEITLDLGADYDVTGLLYQPRNDNNDHGIITSYTVSVSADGTNFQPVGSGNWADDPSLKKAAFAGPAARFVRLQALAGGAGYASAAEINVLGTPTP